MSFLRRAVGLESGISLAVLAWLSVVAACSSEDRPPAGGGSSGGVDAALPDSPVTPTEAGADAADGAPTTSTTPLGDLPTLDEPDVPCVMAGGTRTKLFGAGDAGTGGPQVRLLQALGTARFGAGPILDGFVTFDATGASPQLFPITLGSVTTSFVSEGGTIGAMALNGATVDYQRYTAAGAVQGASVPIATGISPPATSQWIGAGGGGSLAVWFTGSTLSAGGVTAAGASAGPAWTLATGAANPVVSISYAAGKYVIAYSMTSNNMNSAWVQLADATGPSGAAVKLTSGTGPIVIVAIAPTSSGYLVIFDGGGDDLVYALPLDATAKVSGPARRLLGGDAPWAIASRGTDVGLVTMSNDVKVGPKEGPRRPQFRSLDTTGKPLGPWVCLDGQVSAGLYQDMGVLGETGGYSVAFKTVMDETALQRFDKLGTGAQ